MNEVGIGSGSGRPTLRGRVTATELLGAEILVHAEIAAEPVLTEEVREVVSNIDASALENLEAEARRRHATIVGRLGPNHPVRNNDIVDIPIDATTLHFFDLDSGLAIRGEE